ncbi:MAG: peptidoglycan-binding domain-containing protein [Candidatus Omnitrophica bacterium]|nr:peptidoglycan-binding domain-containing protein [Candidatus Omnitrophota bacterium]
MWGKLLLTVLLVFGLAGCATTGKSKSNSQCQELQDKLTETESRLQQKDEEVRNLEEELNKVKSEGLTVSQEFSSEGAKPTDKNIQTALKNAGFYNGEIDGKIGKMTMAAIEEFQKSNGLKADGKVGPQTWSKLKKYLE